MTEPAPPVGTARRRLTLGLVVLAVLALSAASQWWAGRQERRIGAEVAALARPGDIRMIASETCSVCHFARGWMNEHRIAFAECVIEKDAACRAEYEALAAPGTPVLVVRGKAQLGFRPERLLQGLRG